MSTSSELFLGDVLRYLGLTVLPHQDKIPWRPTAADKVAAWKLFTEVRTRITTEPLHYRSGHEVTALTSVFRLFGFSRDLIKEQGVDCFLFAEITTKMLNEKIRPFTAYWHKQKEDGKFSIEDVRHKFRGELKELQQYLVRYTNVLGQMAVPGAYGDVDLHGDGIQIASAQQRPRPSASPFLFRSDTELYGEDGTALQDDIAQVIFDKENEEIGKRREQVRDDEDFPGTVGIALSGGGIRSSTFALGVLQSFANRGLLLKVDYLSTVSGGGYLGAFVSSYFNSAGTRGKNPTWDELLPDSPALRYLRDNADYLESRSSFQRIRTVAFIVYGIVANALSIVPVFALLLFLSLFWPLDYLLNAIFEPSGWVLPSVVWKIMITGSAFLLLSYPILERMKLDPLSKLHSALSVGIPGLLGLAVGIELVARVARFFVIEDVALVGSSIVALPIASVLLTLVARFTGADGAESLLSLLIKGKGVILKVARILAGLAGIALPIAIYLFLAYRLVGVEESSNWRNPFLYAGIVVAFGLYILLFLNINRTSLHVLYRNRLCRTFLIHSAATPTGVAERGRLLLSDLNSGTMAPYHLVNSAVNVPKSREKTLQGRRADFFVFSKHFCGSESTGYCSTEYLQNMDSGLDLGTAMAISGAAASTLMGTFSVKQVHWLLTLFNIRLGYWLRNPSRLKRRVLAKVWPGPGPTYLWREYFGSADETLGYVNVSDGGHLENLGVYELLRRRSKLIIAIDGEADGELRCKSLIQLIRYAEVDLNVTIDIDLDDIRTIDNGLSRSHFNLGRIDYRSKGGSNPDGTGFLLYLKASLTGDEPLPVLDYRSVHKTYPHQSTADQFFDEAQFEAYRQLGHHIGEELFRDELLSRPFAQVGTWLSDLERNLISH